MLGQNEQLQIYQDRFRYLYGTVFILAVILFSRLWYLQILHGDRLKRVSEENRLKKITIEAPRGMIFDRNRNLLIDNQPTFSVTITPQYFYIATANDREMALEKLSKIIKTPVENIISTLRKVERQPKFQPVVIKTKLTKDEVAEIETEKLDLPGIDVAIGIQRTNVFSEVSAHLYGYIAKITAQDLTRLNQGKHKYSNDDSVGKFGLEQQWENTLRGVDGEEYVEVDAYGRKKANLANKKTVENTSTEITSNNDESDVLGDLKSRPSTPGNNIVLTIDLDLQKTAAEMFKKDNKTGALVAIDPTNGEVLSMLSWPSFDSTEFSIGIDPEVWKQLINDENTPLMDKTIQGSYSPGSTFKIISTIAGIEEGLINENTIVNAGESFRFGSRVYHDHRKGGFGATDIIKALENSVDVFYYKLGTRIDIDVLAKYAHYLGLGQKSGISLPGEVPGLMPTRDWKEKTFGIEWYPGETLSVIIGQGALNATPLQLANMMAAIANGGTLYKPRLIKQIESPDGKLITASSPEILQQHQFKPETMRLLKEGLNAVVQGKTGTAKLAAIPGIPVAGKTGTAQIIRFAADKVMNTKCPTLERKYRHHGLFVAFAPIDDPKIAVSVVAEHSCAGATGAAPIAMAVIKRYLEKIMPEEYGPEARKRRVKEAKAHSLEQKESGDVYLEE